MKTSYKISIFTYLFYLLLILSGYINYLIIYLIIMFFHEMGHFIMIKIFRLHIDSIHIYPFGGTIKTNINYNLPSTKLFLISIAGIVMQILLLLVCPKAPSYNYQIFRELNLSIIVFNLLPIIPSDGSKILTSIIETTIKYRYTLIIVNIISFACLFILFIISKNIFIFTILYYMNIHNIMYFKYIFHKFKLERYLYPPNYYHKKYINSENNLYKCRKNYIKCDSIYLEEGEYFTKKFG